MTTVHKKNEVASPSLGRLAGVAPTLSSTPKTSPFESKMATAKWEANFASGNDYYRGKSYLHSGPDSLISRLGADLSKVSKTGSFKMSQGEMYDYLREGISLPQAAALQSQNPSPEYWVQKGTEREVLPGSLSFAHYGEKARLVEIKNAVDAFRQHEVPPHVAQKLLLNGFTDAHLGGVLDMDQKIRLFERFKYQASTNENVETNAAATIDALLDGRLPFGLFEQDFKRTSLTAALDAVYPKKRQGASSRTQESLSEAGRQYLRNNPDELVSVVAVMESPEGKYSQFEDAYKSIRVFGLEASLEYSPRLLMKQREDGALVGVEGARIARDFRNFCLDAYKDHPSIVVSASPHDGIRIVSRGDRNIDHKASYLDIIEMKEAGASNETLLDLLYTQQLSGSQAIAVIKGETVASIGKGWL